MDTETREYLSEFGITDVNIDGLDLFASTQAPEDGQAYDDPTICDPFVLTAGQVATLRGALRATANRMFEAMAASQLGFYPTPDNGWDNEVARMLGIENILGEAWAACKGADFVVPDSIPDDDIV